MTIMIIQFVKGEGLRVVFVATSTYRYDTERGSQRVKQFVSYGFVCCQENESYLTSVFPKVIPFPSFGMCGYAHIYTEKFLHFAKWISIHELLFLNGKLLVAIWWSVVTYPSCCSNCILTCAKAVECFFREMVLALISLWYTVTVDDG